MKTSQISFDTTHINEPSPSAGQLWLGDCLELMPQIPDNSIKVVVTSPPYNLRNTTGGGLLRDGGAFSKGRKSETVTALITTRCLTANTLLGNALASTK